MTVIISGLFYRVSANQTHESLKYGYTHRVRRARIHPRSTGKQDKPFFNNQHNTSAATSIHGICSIVLGPMDALTSRLNSNDIHPFSKLRQLEPLRINHLFDLRLIDTPVLMHVPNVSTDIQIKRQYCSSSKSSRGWDAVWGRLTP